MRNNDVSGDTTTLYGDGCSLTFLERDPGKKRIHACSRPNSCVISVCCRSISNTISQNHFVMCGGVCSGLDLKSHWMYQVPWSLVKTISVLVKWIWTADYECLNIISSSELQDTFHRQRYIDNDDKINIVYLNMVSISYLDTFHTLRFRLMESCIQTIAETASHEDEIILWGWSSPGKFWVRLTKFCV